MRAPGEARAATTRDARLPQRPVSASRAHRPPGAISKKAGLRIAAQGMAVDSSAGGGGVGEDDEEEDDAEAREPAKYGKMTAQLLHKSRQLLSSINTDEGAGWGGVVNPYKTTFPHRRSSLCCPST